MSSEEQKPTPEGPIPEGAGPAMSYTSPFRRPAAPEPPAAPSPVAEPARNGRRTMAFAAAATLLLVVAGGAGGAVVAHEFWTTSGVTTTTVASVPPATTTPAPASPITPVAPGGGTGSFGGQGLPSVTPNGNGGYTIRGGGVTITVGPNGIHFGNGGSGSSGSSAPSGSAGPANAAGIAAKVSPAIVNINTTYSYQGGLGAGTGIVISSDGEVLTNNHVIDGATHITATDIGNGKTYEATVVGYDPSHDVAVLQLQGASGLTTATLGDSSKLSVGDKVLGLGNAGGAGGTPSTAGGSITGLDKSITAGDMLGGKSERLSGLIQTNAAVEPGDSGGPLVDSQGSVIGMVTAGGASGGGLGLGFRSSGAQAFAVPIDTAEAAATQITSGQGSPAVHIGPTAFLGVSVASSGFPGLGSFGGSGSSNGSGVTVGSVLNGQAAEKAGLAAGDVITAINGQSIGSSNDLTKLMFALHPGDTIKLSWTDAGGQSRAASVRLGSGPPA